MKEACGFCSKTTYMHRLQTQCSCYCRIKSTSRNLWISYFQLEKILKRHTIQGPLQYQIKRHIARSHNASNTQNLRLESQPLCYLMGFSTALLLRHLWNFHSVPWGQTWNITIWYFNRKWNGNVLPTVVAVTGRHGDATTEMHLPHYWPFVRGNHRRRIHESSVDRHHKLPIIQNFDNFLLVTWTRLNRQSNGPEMRRFNTHMTSPEWCAPNLGLRLGNTEEGQCGKSSHGSPSSWVIVPR